MLRLTLSTLVLTLLISINPISIFCQDLEVDGTAKISTMSVDNTVDDIVIRKADGTLGTRDASTIGGSTSIQVNINGSPASNLGLSYMGPSSAGPQGLKADQFVSDEGYYVNIYEYDSLTHETLYFTDNNACTGTTYVEAGKVGRGGVVNGDNALLYVPKTGSVVAEITYLSRLIFNPGAAPACNTSSSTRKLVFQVLPNAPGTTGINLDPMLTYSVTFGM